MRTSFSGNVVYIRDAQEIFNLLQQYHGQPDGFAMLDSSGLLSVSNIPQIAIGRVFTANSEAEMLSLEIEEGDVVRRTDVDITYMKNNGTSGTVADFTVISSDPAATETILGTVRFAMLSEVATGTNDSKAVTPEGVKQETSAVQSNLTDHVTDTDNPHSVTYVQVGADQLGSASAVQDNLDTHTSDTSNPHAVTAVQVGVDKAYVDALNVNADTLDGQDSTYYLNIATNFGGDVSGTYNAIVIADDSHNHVISNIDGLQAALNSKVDENSAITAATATKITYDSKGLVTGGTFLSENDIPALGTAKITSGTFADVRISESSVTQYIDKAYVDTLNVDADTVDGFDSSAFAQLSGANFTGNITVPNDGAVGSFSTPNAMTIDSSGSVLFEKDITLTGNLTVNGYISGYDSNTNGIIDKAETVDDGTYSSSAQEVRELLDSDPVSQAMIFSIALG